MKKILLLITLSLLIFSMTGCSLFGPKIVKETETNITKISVERMEELVIANNDVVDTIYGNPKFFTTAELRGHVSELYTEEVIKNYFSQKVFYDKDNKVYSTVSTDNRKNISKMKFTIDSNTIKLMNDTQTFTVSFTDGETEYLLDFSVIYNEKQNEWLLCDIYL